MGKYEVLKKETEDLL